jgi:hypothetical protein
VGVAAELGELLVQALDLVHVAEEVLARLALDHGHEALLLDERVIAHGELPARHPRARASWGERLDSRPDPSKVRQTIRQVHLTIRKVSRTFSDER